jgi:hypothetical protein
MMLILIISQSHMLIIIYVYIISYMSLVVYNPSGTNKPSSVGCASNNRKADSEYQAIRDKLQSLMAESREKPFLGLSN